MFRFVQSIGDDLRDWELYADMIKRTSQAQVLTAQSARKGLGAAFTMELPRKRAD